MFDIAIIGAGVAGLSAALTASARNKKTVVISGAGIESSAMYKAEIVNNYLGMPEMSGRDMMNAFYSHAIASGAEIISGRAMQIMAGNGRFMIQVEQEIIEARAVILAVGVIRTKRVKNEEKFVGKGVSYCATCDAMLYRGKKVAVVSQTSEGAEDIKLLIEVCGKDNVKIIDSEVKEIIGNETVTAVVTENETIECDGVFFIREAMPIESLIYGLETKNGVIAIDSDGKTNIKGVFACGDCAGAPYQAAKAAGEGLVAALSAAKIV